MKIIGVLLLLVGVAYGVSFCISNGADIKTFEAFHFILIETLCAGGGVYCLVK